MKYSRKTTILGTLVATASILATFLPPALPNPSTNTRITRVKDHTLEIIRSHNGRRYYVSPQNRTEFEHNYQINLEPKQNKMYLLIIDKKTRIQTESSLTDLFE